MGRGNSEKFDSCNICDPLPAEAILIIGAGYFGRRAAKILNRSPFQGKPLFIIDSDKDHLSNVEGAFLERILCDGIQFLVKNFQLLHPSNMIIPAVPFHFAYEFLKNYSCKSTSIKKLKVPEGIKPSLPHTWEGSDGSLLVSYADFTCPVDCPEPSSHCTVTGEKRGKPLNQLLAQLDIKGYRLHFIRSRQLAPGLGGYKVDDLGKLITRVEQEECEKWLVGTACRCHGTITAFSVHS